MEPYQFAAAEVQVPTGIPTGVSEAASKVVADGGVVGALLILALAGVVALALYIKSLHATRGAESKESEKALSDLQEKRIEELRSLTRAQADAEAVLSKFTETVQGMARTLESLGSSLRESSLKQDATAQMVRETLSRIEGDIDELSKKIDRPLVQTKQGLARTPGGLS